MFVLLFFLLVAVGNFALGFGLAVWMGHGPAWADWDDSRQTLNRLRSSFRSRRPGAPRP